VDTVTSFLDFEKTNHDLADLENMQASLCMRSESSCRPARAGLLQNKLVFPVISTYLPAYLKTDVEKVFARENQKFGSLHRAISFIDG
jgi:hypothetical protein